MSRYLKADTPFFDNVSGEPVGLGTIYFGEPNTDPTDQGSNAKVPYSNRALSVAIASEQTLTSAGKTATDIWLDGAYSITVKDSAGVQVFADAYVEMSTGGGGGSGDLPLTVSTDVTGYNLTSLPDNRLVEIIGNNDADVTIPAESTEDLGTAFLSYISNLGSGTVQWVAADGVTLIPPAGGTLIVAENGTSCAYKSASAANTWKIVGDVVPS